MKKILPLLAASMLTFAAHAQTTLVASNTTSPAQTTTKTAVLADDVLTLKEAEFDFGKIPQGKPVTHIFEVVNNGKDSLHIQNVQASCGCTTPEWDREKVQAPGEQTKITVGYNAASEGAFTKQITITYNGTQTKQLLIKGEVWKTPATSVPENKDLGSLKD
ncbi:MAG: DUF1573 domain-containing protein [Ferruginibacter sp.]|nr:DUF1573 domain-containing protein [Ferruginibacter sp.]